MKQQYELTHHDYDTGHPWYYFLGGSILTVKQIRDEVQADGYCGYLESYIAEADRKPEPQRSAMLRKFKRRAIDDLKRDLSGYRKRVLEMHRHRKQNPKSGVWRACDDVHTNISLKYNHLYNDFAHLIYLDDLLNRQGDLFGR